MKFEVEMSSSSFCLMTQKNNMHQKNTSEKKKTMSPPMMTYEEKEKKNQQQLQPSSNPSTSQSLLDIEKKDTTRPNGTATTIGCGAASSLLNIVQMKENHSNRRRSDIYTNNIALNEEIQKQTNSKEEKDVLIKPNRMPSIAPAQPSALLSKLSAFLPQMHEANLQLEEKIQKNPILAKREIEIDAVLDEEADDATDDAEEEEEEGKPQIEMSLGMGVVDLKTAEVVEEVEKLVGGFANNEWNSKSEKTNDDAEGEEDENIEKAHKKKKKKKIEVL
jgi:hypothetical protein